MAHEIARGGVAARGQAHAALGREHGARAVGEQPIEAGDGRRRAASRQAARSAGASGGACRRLAISTSRDGRTRPLSDRVQQDLRAGVVAGEQRSRPEHLGGEAAEHLGEPVERVGVARAVLGVAVQRQVGEHDAEAVGELLDRRLPLLVREQRRVQQRERRTGAELAVGDARAVGVVVEAQPHRSHRKDRHARARTERRRARGAHLQWAAP